MTSAFTSTAEAMGFVPQHEGKLPGPMVLGSGDKSPEVMLIKSAPSYADFKTGQPLSGQDGLPIRKALFHSDISFYAAAAFPFYVKGKVKIKDAREYAGILSEEIRRVNPPAVVMLGAEAARWTTDFPVPFKKHSEVLGRIFEADGRKWCVAKASNVISGVPYEYRAFIDSIQKLLGEEEELEEEKLREKYTRVTFPQLARTILSTLPRRAALDIETDGLDHYTCNILTLQVSAHAGTGYSFPWDIMTPPEWAAILGGREWVFQNGSFDAKVLAANGVFLKVSEDTMLMHSLVDETPGTHSLDAMAYRYLGIEKWSELVDFEKMDQVNADDLARYGARDTDLTLRLANVFKPQTQKRFIHSVLHDLQNALIHSEVRGIRVDTEKAEQFDRDIKAALHDSQQRMEDTYNLQNPNSPKQVLGLLLELGVPLVKTKGKYSTAEEAISPFVELFPVVRDVLEYRHLTKARSTYVRNILEGSEHDGRYHPDYSLARTETGRLSEKLITLIPRASSGDSPDLGHQYQARLRELFIPDPGMVMIGADYSGLELAMAAYLSKDPVLTGHIAAGRDTHSLLAIQAFNLPVDPEPHDTLKKRVEERYSHQRTLAKQLTFGYLFGSSGLSMTKFMSMEDAEQLIAALKSQYRRLDDWQQEVRAQARKGYVETPWGRRRHFYYDDALDDRVHAQQDRECINFPIQAQATDMNSLAFARLTQMGYQTLFPLHDAIYIQVPEDQVDRACRDVKEVMEGILPGQVPFRADLKVGYSWAEL